MRKLVCLILFASFCTMGIAQNVQLATIEVPTTVVVESKKEVILKAVFPNPVKYSFILKVDRNALLTGKIDFELWNKDDELLFEQRLGQPFEIIERGHLPEGEYEYRVSRDGDVVQTGKLIFSPF